MTDGHHKLTLAIVACAIKRPHVDAWQSPIWLQAEIAIEVGLLLPCVSGSRHHVVEMKRAGARAPLSPMLDLGSRQKEPMVVWGVIPAAPSCSTNKLRCVLLFVVLAFQQDQAGAGFEYQRHVDGEAKALAALVRERCADLDENVFLVVAA